jgi:LemA protein
MLRTLLLRRKTSKREHEVRRSLGLSEAPKQGTLQALRKYVAEHYKSILVALTLATCALTYIYYYNKFTAMEQQVQSLRSQVEGGLQMRQNVIASLAVAVSRFLSHEKGVFLSAVKARESSLGAPKGAEELLESLKDISGKDVSPSDLSRFMAVAENYPGLVSSGSYQLLISQIADVENQVYKKRIEYNETVARYNTGVSTFPGNAVAATLGFRVEPYFGWDKKAEWALTVDPKQEEPPLTMQSEGVDPKK